MDFIDIETKLNLNNNDNTKILCSKKTYKEYAQNQIGGHPNSIIALEHKILKKAKLSEFQFYKFINSQEASKTLKLLILPIIPKFQGTETINKENYLIMENLHCGFEHFNIMDIKLGKITWSEKSPKAKIERKQKHNSKNTTNSLGFRVTGILTRNCAGEILVNLSKKDVDIRIQTKEDLLPYFIHFVSSNGKVLYSVLNGIVYEIKNILCAFKMQKEKKFISSSLYFVVGKNNKLQVKLIDFSNVEESEGSLDYNVIEALEELLKIWKLITSL